MMFIKGIGEGSRFADCHPIVNFIYYMLVIGITMFSMAPAFLAVTLGLAWAYSLLLKGRKAVRSNILCTLPVIVVMGLVNALFTHNGATVLFYINGSRITLEAFAYGIAGAVMLSAVLIWFSSFNVIMTGDKLIYLFGKGAPVLGLTLSMIFRFIPLLKNRYKEISLGQRCMGRHVEGSLFQKVRQVCKEVSILISWSLEASIETSDSMEARGYGLHSRTSFHLFKMSPTDYLMLTVVCVTGTISVIGCALGKTTIYYYPKIASMEWDLMTIVTLISFAVLASLPLIVDIAGERKWQQLKFEI